jgi:hypothetical protein
MAAELLLVATDRLALEGRPLTNLSGLELAVAGHSSIVLPRSKREADGKLEGALRGELSTVRRAALDPLVSGGPRRRRHGP